jgi:ABC-type uncharacterized transport system substrate-binding protein
MRVIEADDPMKTVSLAALAASTTLLGLLAAAPAVAHPHVFVDARVETVFDAEGRITALRHVWRFDDAFSAFASQGLDTDGDGILTVDELKPLAKVNVDSLKDYDYFTTFRSAGRRVGFKLPTEYWLQMNDGFLTLFYTLQLMQPVNPGADGVTIDVYDPSYFVDYQMVEQNPDPLIGAPAGCTAELRRKGEPDAATAAILGQIPVSEREIPASLRAVTNELVNRVTIRCR